MKGEGFVKWMKRSPMAVMLGATAAVVIALLTIMNGALPLYDRFIAEDQRPEATLCAAIISQGRTSELIVEFRNPSEHETEVRSVQALCASPKYPRPISIAAINSAPSSFLTGSGLQPLPLALPPRRSVQLSLLFLNEQGRSAFAECASIGVEWKTNDEARSTTALHELPAQTASITWGCFGVS